MNQPQPYHFWKKPSQKWWMLALTAQCGLLLWADLMRYREVSQPEIREKTFSPAGWASYAAGEYLTMSSRLVVLCLCLGCFAVGHFAASKQAADRAMGLLCLALALPWGAMALAFPILESGIRLALWLVTLLGLLGGGLYCVMTSRRDRQPK